MSKKTLFFIGIVVIVVLVGGIYWYLQREKIFVLPREEDLSYETETLSEDIADLKIIEEDKSLDTLEEDLSAIAGEIPLEKELSPTERFDLSEIENLEEELAFELDGILDDLTDLEGYEADTSLTDLSNLLSAW